MTAPVLKQQFLGNNAEAMETGATKQIEPQPADRAPTPNPSRRPGPLPPVRAKPKSRASRPIRPATAQRAANSHALPGTDHGPHMQKAVLFVLLLFGSIALVDLGAQIPVEQCCQALFDFLWNLSGRQFNLF
jgi:hypothetical protein